MDFCKIMKPSEALQKLGDFFEKQSNINFTPFAVEYLNARLEEISTMPDKPSRKGIPRDEQKPFPKSKMVLALMVTFSPKLHLKKFSEGLELSYGVVRQWVRAASFGEELFKTALDFETKYINRLKELIELEDSSSAIAHIRELKHYQSLMMVIQINRMAMDVILEYSKTDKAPIIVNLNHILMMTMVKREDIGSMEQ
jgi:hypothetical protein